MVNRALVSVIVPVYNGERFLDEALRSILDQTYPSVEIIVVDDGSVDQSAEIIQAYKNIQYIYQANQGVTVARNTGVSVAQGEFIAFLDQDDRWTPHKLTEQIGYLQDHSEVGFVLSHARMFLENGAGVPTWLKADYVSEDHVGFIPGTFTVRKQIFKEIGGFDANLQIASDIDWFSRAIDAGVKLYVLPEVLLHKRVHTANLSFQEEAIRGELLKLFRASIQRKRSKQSDE